MKKKLFLSLVCALLVLTAVGCSKANDGDSHTHDYEDTVVQSTSGSRQYILLKCKVCGYENEEKFTAGLEIEADEEKMTCVVKGKGECKDKEINIPSVISGYTVEGIAKRAFSGERRITAVKIPDSVTSIGDYAFYGCSRLASVNIPGGVTDMGKHTFDGCGSLKSINIPDGVTSIGTAVFFSCNGIESITIPSSVKKIGMQALTSENLKNVFYGGTEEEWSKISLDYGNGPLSSATKYYYSETEPATSGNYWRYVDGVPTIWE